MFTIPDVIGILALAIAIIAGVRFLFVLLLRGSQEEDREVLRQHFGDGV